MKNTFALLALALSSTNALASTLINQDSQDTQVIQARFAQKINDGSNSSYSDSGVSIDLRRCPQTSQHARNCTVEFDQMALQGRPYGHLLIHPFIVYGAYPREDGSGELYSEYLNCSVVEIRTVTRKSAFESPSFRGIGFYSNQGGPSDFFIPKDDLVDNGYATLKDGEPAIIHRFVGVGYCWRGTMSSSTYQTFEFKPYAQYEKAGPNGDLLIYKNWEALKKNHSLGQELYQPFVGSWDRRGDLLR